MNIIISILCWWAWIGLFMVMFFPKSKTRIQALCVTLICGPLVWVGVLMFGLKYLPKNKG